MGKRKKNKDKKSISGRRFVRKYCNRCKICHSPNPTYCFDAVYKSDPKAFTTGIFPELFRIHWWPDPSAEETSKFKSIFCPPDVCNISAANGGGRCIHFNECITAFRSQVEKGRFESNNYQRQQQAASVKRKGNKSKTPDPTITFIINDNQEWRERIERILNGSNNKQQAVTTASSG